MLNPRPEQVLPRTFWPVLALSLCSALAGQALLALRPVDFTLHYFRNPTVLAAVHLTSLGWLATLFLGVGGQALNVLLHRPQARPWPGLVGAALFFVGAMALAAFLAGARGHGGLGLAVFGLGGGYAVMAARAWRLSRGSEVRGRAWHGLRAAYAYLGALLALGTAMACGLLEPLLPQAPLSTLNLHIHLALAGFAGMAIVGLLPKMLRLFLGAKGYASWPGRVAVLGVHAGLACHLGAWLWQRPGLAQAGTALLAAAALGLAGQVLVIVRAATKPLASSSFSTQALACGWLLAAVGMDLCLTFHEASWRLSATACYLALFGWIGGTLLGTAQRIVAVLAWIQRFHEDPPQHQVPTAWALVDPRLAWSVPLLHTLAVADGGFGLATGNPGCLRVSGLLGASAIAATLALAALSLRRGRKQPFTGGVNPYGAQ